MDRLAIDIVETCIKFQEWYLDLGNCGLIDADMAKGSELDILMRQCTHVEVLAFGTAWRNDISGPWITSQNVGKPNKLKAIPTFISAMPELTKLIICGEEKHHLGISDLRPLTNLTKLTWLNLSYCKIKKLEFPEHLKELTSLIIKGNRITELTGFDKVPKILRLDIGSNHLTSLKGVEKLLNLERANFQDNKLTDLRPLLPLLTRRTNISVMVEKDDYELDRYDFNLKDNPVVSPPVEIVAQGNKAIINYFDALDDQAIINMEAKCILFGNGKAGKTTISYQLRKGEFLKEDNRTHGILIETWEVGPPDFPDALIQKINGLSKKLQLASLYGERSELILRINFWDFGGQEYYHATHRLFMTSNILYLLLWEEQTNKQNEHAGEYPFSYWIKNINHFSPENFTLNIQNKIDGYCQQVNQLTHFKINFRDNCLPDSIGQYDRDISLLRKAILENVSNLSYVGIPFPKVYNDIRLALRKDTRNFIDYKEYQAVCKRNDHTSIKMMNDPSQQETLINFLDTTGAIVCFRFRKQKSSRTNVDRSTHRKVQQVLLNEYVFINPKWLTNVIYEILEKNKFEFDNEHVEKITSLHKIESSLWIQIMKEFELIFEINRKGIKRYIVPQYLPEQVESQMALDMAFEGRKMQHSFTLLYPEFLPKSNFLRFVSRYGNENTNYLFWKYGLVFIKENKAVFASCIYESQTIIIEIQDNDKKLTYELFNVLFEIDEADNLLVSVNKTDYVNVKKLKEKKANGNLEIETVKNKTIKVADFDNLLVMPKIEKVTEQITQHPITYNEIIDKMATKKTIRIFLASSSELKTERDQFEIFINRENKELNHKGIFLYLEIWEDFIDSISQTRLQDEYNKAIAECDIFIMLFCTKVGKYTAEEFEVAFKQFKVSDKPRIYTYFKNDSLKTNGLNREELKSLWNFQDRLKTLGHFNTEFETNEGLHLHFKKQLEKLKYLEP